MRGTVIGNHGKRYVNGNPGKRYGYGEPWQEVRLTGTLARGTINRNPAKRFLWTLSPNRQITETGGRRGRRGGGVRSRGPEPATSPRPPEVQGIAATSLPKGVNARVTFCAAAGSVDSQRRSRRSSVVIVHCLSGFLAEWRVFITILHTNLILVIIMYVHV